MRLEDVKLKHLAWVSDNQIRYDRIMVEALGFNKRNPFKRFLFVRYFKKAFKLGQLIAEYDPQGTSYDKEKGKIKIPESIDHIPFIARMELESAISTVSKKSIWEDVAQTIAIVCFFENKVIPFKSESQEFLNFVNEILEQPLIEMLGLFNDILSWADSSRVDWGRRFDEVSSTDPDYIQAGGVLLNRFNVIVTIRNTCNDMNVTYDDAWQLPYVVIQTNELSKATAANIQDRMTKIKEARMKAQRAQK